MTGLVTGLAIEDVGVRIGGRTLVDGVTLEAPRGAVTGVIGPNGAGKSTLLRAIAGVLPHAGRVTLDGAPLPRPGSRARARLIGFLPQGQDVHWPVTARRAVELGRLPHLGPWQSLARADVAAVEAALAKTDSTRFADRPVTALSGGERARVLLARVLAAHTAVILADEPVAALDPGHQLAVMEMLCDEARAEHRAVVVVLHDLSLAARACERLVLMDQGRVVTAGPAEAVLASPWLDRVYAVRFGQGRVQAVPVVTPVRRLDVEECRREPQRHAS
ncbi:ABC transporter ATP-binding protein [Roseospira marina]|uniref:ABC transporter ATP-binding protein n=1 Tax=Roseospira marina TaxID=140057 RepID=A0A5M6I9U8_9PROT|nr:ABC transporter ATP-binding protein [Roseospira marina]KAA5604458.1 ABC transporter ATP-binding protein [Roseospira marina]MBB4315503.1 iron complex transport system ATP-binding protein [Roseospira marina]MBB5088560.1 iron complex transport system ATP-binding protein [Roseospira marina]